MTKLNKDERYLKGLIKSSLMEEPSQEINQRIMTRIEKYQSRKAHFSNIPWVGLSVVAILLTSVIYLVLAQNTIPVTNYFTLPELNNFTFQFDINPLFSLALIAIAIASWALIFMENLRKKQIS